MRPVRLSDIEIAKAEVATLTSLGVKPDAAVLMLAALELPPVREDRVSGGEPGSEAEEPRTHKVPPRHAGDLAPATEMWAASPEFIAEPGEAFVIDLVVPTTTGGELVKVRMENLSARDANSVLQTASDEKYAYRLAITNVGHVPVTPGGRSVYGRGTSIWATNQAVQEVEDLIFGRDESAREEPRNVFTQEQIDQGFGFLSDAQQQAAQQQAARDQNARDLNPVQDQKNR